MKRSNVLCLLVGLVAGGSSATAQPTLTVPASVMTAVRSVVYVPVILKLDGVTNLAAFEVSFTLFSSKPSTIVVGAPIIESAADIPAKSLNCVNASEVWLCLVDGVNPNGINANIIAAGGKVFVIPIEVGTNFPGGTLTLSAGFGAVEPAAPIAIIANGVCNLLPPS